MHWLLTIKAENYYKKNYSDGKTKSNNIKVKYFHF